MNASLIFDCDGVLADTERLAHLPAFNQMFAEFELPVRWSEVDYASKLAVGGGKERLATLLSPSFVAAAGLPRSPEAQQRLIAEWHQRKTELYTEAIDSGVLPPRPGIRRVAAEAVDSGWQVAVASTSSEVSVRAVLRQAVGEDLARHFVVLAGDVVPRKKPAADIYLLALKVLGVSPRSTVAIEDSENGLRAARGAELTCVITVNDYTRGQDFSSAALVVTSLGDPGGPPTQVLCHPGHGHLGQWIELSDLAACRPRTEG